jgi:hypothetical protein
MDLTTLNIDNYSDHELFNLFDIEVENIHNQDLLKEKYDLLTDNMIETSVDIELKNRINFFLEQAYYKLLEISIDDKYDPEQSKFLPNLEKNRVFNNQHFIIKKNPKEDLTKLINPIPRKSISKLLNINSLFRRDYYKTKSTDFTFELSQSLNNVISLSLETAEIKNTHYTFSDTLQTNQFSIELYDYNLTTTNGATIGIDTNTIKKRVVYMKNGNYTGKELEDYLNKHIFSHGELTRIACKYDKHTMKFNFFKDNRDDDKGGKKDTNDVSYRFNIDFRIVSNPNREIQRNMGWILGYRKQKYTYDDDYIVKDKVTTSKLEGFNPEAVLKMLNMPYIYLSIDCFNNNHSQTIISPFEKSVINDTSILAKLTYNLGHEYNYDKSSRAYGFIRDYFGPVNISRMKVRILDPLGNVVDFNNNDISFTLKCEQVYDLNTA